MKLLAIILFLTVFEAIHEGLALQGKKTLAGIIEMVKLAGIVVIIVWALYTHDFDDYFQSFGYMFWHFITPLVLGWAFVRYAIFDFIHNACAGINLVYIGKVKWFDRFFNQLVNIWFKTEPRFFFWWTRVIFLLTGLWIILKI